MKHNGVRDRTLVVCYSKNVRQHLEVLEPDGKDLGKLSSLHSQLGDKFSRLKVIQKEISSLPLEDTSTHSEFETDFEAAESYRDSYLDLKTKVEASQKSSRGLMKCSSTDNAPKLKLPKFELKKFSGDPKEFLTFWSIFSKIHESDDLTEIDKFQYLYQCMVHESRSARLIFSFPITAENYSKAIQQLKARFGREELLVQIYVRNLLSLVMKNAVAGRNSPDLATLYDMLETKLRAFESLGRTKEKFADFLEPLVESCLPESVLRAWERSRISGVADDSTSQRSVEKLMSFLRHEVESEKTIKLAREGFVKNGGTFKRNKSAVLDTTDTATTAMLVSTNYSYVGASTAAIHTKLGWTFIGKETGLYSSDDYPIMDSVQTVLSLYVNNASLRELWDIESLDIREPNENVSKRKAFDEQLIEFHEKLTVFPDGRYEVELPWKLDAKTNLPDNKHLTSKRQEKAMSRASNRDYLDEYQKIFNEWENLKIIERVPDLEINKNSHYLPHRPVIKNSSETTKVRPVFDASAREKGKPSLKQCLFTGPNLIESLPDILDRFRMFPIGLSADIEKAFLQIGIAPHDRDYLRFFYPRDEGEIYRHCRVVFGVTSSPFILSACIEYLKDRAPHDFSDLVQKLRQSFYVDNCLTDVKDVSEEKYFIEMVQKVMSTACFNLRGWESNFPCKYMSKSSGVTGVLGTL
ncbi:hypothetical protein AVEN_68275-1 [Araneus ventricosus]|uniref:Reverse transcriptase domain-containing protein n=1 Tax=Araneus ventricosus TaxID=182803 RepID=A0A4Y2HLB5_ARAVE|nr:hypothetical protein AVEN_68275-1 [Araneus ventricosus]